MKTKQPQTKSLHFLGQQAVSTPPATEAFLRDMAFVLEMTRKVKSAILADKSSDTRTLTNSLESLTP